MRIFAHLPGRWDSYFDSVQCYHFTSFLYFGFFQHNFLPTRAEYRAPCRTIHPSGCRRARRPQSALLATICVTRYYFKSRRRFFSEVSRFLRYKSPRVIFQCKINCFGLFLPTSGGGHFDFSDLRTHGAIGLRMKSDDHFYRLSATSSASIPCQHANKC